MLRFDIVPSDGDWTLCLIGRKVYLPFVWSLLNTVDTIRIEHKFH